MSCEQGVPPFRGPAQCNTIFITSTWRYEFGHGHFLMQQRSLPILQSKQHSLPVSHIDQEEHHNIAPQQLLVHKHPEEQHLLQSKIKKQNINGRKYN